MCSEILCIFLFMILVKGWDSESFPEKAKCKLYGYSWTALS